MSTDESSEKQDEKPVAEVIFNNDKSGFVQTSNDCSEVSLNLSATAQIENKKNQPSEILAILNLVETFNGNVEVSLESSVAVESSVQAAASCDNYSNVDSATINNDGFSITIDSLNTNLTNINNRPRRRPKNIICPCDTESASDRTPYRLVVKSISYKKPRKPSKSISKKKTEDNIIISDYSDDVTMVEPDLQSPVSASEPTSVIVPSTNTILPSAGSVAICSASSSENSVNTATSLVNSANGIPPSNPVIFTNVPVMSATLPAIPATVTASTAAVPLDTTDSIVAKAITGITANLSVPQQKLTVSHRECARALSIDLLCYIDQVLLTQRHREIYLGLGWSEELVSRKISETLAPENSLARIASTFFEYFKTNQVANFECRTLLKWLYQFINKQSYFRFSSDDMLRNVVGIARKMKELYPTNFNIVFYHNTHRICTEKTLPQRRRRLVQTTRERAPPPYQIAVESNIVAENCNNGLMDLVFSQRLQNAGQIRPAQQHTTQLQETVSRSIANPAVQTGKHFLLLQL